MSNASTSSAWFRTTASLGAYAGQTVTLTMTATNDSSLPTSFWLDDVSVLA
ncbi:MAG TPA: hypothetical protein VGN18_14680 [Jatrophihabitans sp.]|uniref:hypothetical protein n=1 Tax=Jatrophihabitans sp. TaxID=1932789 RepID=UPI002DFC9104|nr:hypothetical protein [Jatrophihabitans sp.]